MTQLNIGIIGSGYMGRMHAHAFRALAGMKRYPKRPFLHSIASTSKERAAAQAETMNVANACAHWQEICTHAEIDIVSITAPPDLHHVMAKSAIEAGKAVYLEKPVTPQLDELYELVSLAKQHKTCITIGYNYLHNPMLYHARQMIANGELGKLISFRVIHAEDFMAEEDAPYKYWHPDPQLGGGVILELASHPLSLLHFLIGNFSQVSAHTRQLHTTRKNRAFSGEDHLDCLLAFEDGLQGTLTASWVATGKRMQLECEIYGSEGSINFSQERLNELQVFIQHNKQRGYTTLRASQEHPYFSFLCPGDEHGIGFADLKVLEARQFLDAYFAGKQPDINLISGKIIHEQIAAIKQSVATSRWQQVAYKGM